MFCGLLASYSVWQRPLAGLWGCNGLGNISDLRLEQHRKRNSLTSICDATVLRSGMCHIYFRRFPSFSCWHSFYFWSDWRNFYWWMHRFKYRHPSLQSCSYLLSSLSWQLYSRRLNGYSHRQSSLKFEEFQPSVPTSHRSRFYWEEFCRQ